MQILNAETGYPDDMWTSSVTAFTALIFVVHFNLYTRIKYFTWVHVFSVLGASISPYLIYMWIGNYLPADISPTQFAVEEAHKSSIFYIKIMFCIGTCFILDYGISCWKIIIKENPTDYLRTLISKNLSIGSKVYREHFDMLVLRDELKNRRKMD